MVGLYLLGVSITELRDIWGLVHSLRQQYGPYQRNSNMEKLIELGEKLGLEGKELREFVIEREKVERNERTAQREAQKAETEAQKEAEKTRLQIEKEKAEAQLQIEKEKAEALKEAEKEKAEVEKTKLQVQQRKNDQEYELQREKLRLEHERETNKTKEADATSMAKAPELPVFRDNTDDIETYLERFERIANAYKWDKSNWAIMLSSLLSGKALDVYGRLPISDATDYEKIKGALRKRYNLTEEGFRQKFRMSIPEESENPLEFATRIAIYLDKWIELAEATDYDKLKTLFIKEQFLNICNLKLATYLKEQPFVGITEMCERSERYLQAHSEKLKNSNHRKSEGIEATEGSSNTNHGLSNTDQIPSNTEQRRPKDCYNCRKVGHVRAECGKEGGVNQQLCSKCNKFGHLAEI